MKTNNNELKKHDVGVVMIFFMIFCMVCAGSYGIEDMIPAAGPGLTIFLLIVLPFFWSIPQGLVVSELGSAMPEEGGYYKWVQRALGQFWGFQACWWRTISIYVDSTLYVILAVDYFKAVFAISSEIEFVLKILLILIFTYINVRGMTSIARVASYFSVIVIFSFLLLIGVGFANAQFNPFTPFIPEGQTVVQSIGLGIAICMWMYAGYESMHTMAGEVADPSKISRATILSVPAIMIFYVLSTVACLCAVGSWESWGTDSGISFGSVGDLLGMHWLSLLFVGTALLANLSMYNTYLASGSRGLYSLATDNLFPSFFGKLHKKYKTPHIAVYSMAIINVLLCNFGYDTLVVIDVFMLMFAYILIYIAAVVLRVKEPEMDRPFKIRLGTKGLAMLCTFPVLLCIIALFTNGLDYFIGGCISVISGPVAYLVFKKLYGGIENDRSLNKSDIKLSSLVIIISLISIAVALIIF